MLNTRDSQQKDLQITVFLRAEGGLDKFDYSMPAFKLDSKIPGSMPQVKGPILALFVPYGSIHLPMHAIMKPAFNKHKQ